MENHSSQVSIVQGSSLVVAVVVVLEPIKGKLELICLLILIKDENNMSDRIYATIASTADLPTPVWAESRNVKGQWFYKS